MTTRKPKPVERKATIRRNRRGEDWDDAYKRIHQEYPATQDGNWVLTCADSVLERLLGDLSGRIGATMARTGSRPVPDSETGPGELHELFLLPVQDLRWRGEATEPEYTTLPFIDAFRVLSRGLSLTQIARKTEINRYRVHRLLKGEYQPNGIDMEMIARAFKKDPRYFREYRSVLVAASLLAYLDREPDHSAVLIRKLAADG